VKTAVEWLIEQIIKEKRLVDLDIQAAKEMEREQREADFIAGYEKRAELSNLLFDKISEQSAKELFKQQKE
jgi:hypothetical protein